MSMDDAEHWQKLENLYRTAPINAWYRPAIRIAKGTCEIEMAVRPDFHHAAQAVHGSVYFKLLDDAAFFAANSLVHDAFVVTSNFTIHLLRPVSDGVLLAKGRTISAGRQQLVAESQLYGADERLLAHGVGTFVRTRISLGPEVGYA